MVLNEHTSIVKGITNLAKRNWRGWNADKKSKYAPISCAVASDETADDHSGGIVICKIILDTYHRQNNHRCRMRATLVSYRRWRRMQIKPKGIDRSSSEVDI